MTSSRLIKTNGRTKQKKKDKKISKLLRKCASMMKEKGNGFSQSKIREMKRTGGWRRDKRQNKLFLEKQKIKREQLSLGKQNFNLK